MGDSEMERLRNGKTTKWFDNVW